MKKNKSGFSIIIGMGLVVLITLTAYVILDYIIPFSKNVKGIENASNAYYVAYSGIEKALYHVKTRSNLTTETGSTMPTSAIGYSYNTFSSGNIIPKPGSGNSEYITDYNIISMSEPIQLEIGNGYVSNWSNVKFYFKVPDFDFNSSTTETLSGLALPIINWILSSSNNTLIASGSYITASEVKNSNCSSSCDLTIDSRNGLDLNGTGFTFSNFYNSNCNSTSSGCTLKMSILNDLTLTNGQKIPYLEYKIEFGTNVPDRYTIIKSRGKSYSFQKNLEVRIPQQTVNQALDFTVFQ